MARKRSLQPSSGMRFVAISLVVVWCATALMTSIAPVRADVTTVAVVQFENDAGAPASVVDSLSESLYRAMAQSPNFTVRGSGPIIVKAGIDKESSAAQFRAAANAGADHMLVGDVVAYGGGSVTFRLASYRVSPMAIVRSRSFTQSYPPVNGQALVASLSADVASLEAPRAGTATIYAIKGSEIDADAGSADGFHVDQRFSVIRNGQKLADATIVTIHDAYALISISNESRGYRPAVGDRLVSQESQPPLVPVNTAAGGFNPLYFLLGAAAIVVAIAAKGSVGSFPSPTPIPSGSIAPFIVTGPVVTGGTPANPQLTFTFTQPVSASSQTSILGSTAFAFWTFTPSGGSPSSPATLLALGGASFGSSTTLTVPDSHQGLNTGDTLSFTFTTSITDSGGDHLTITTLSHTASVARQPVGAGAPLAQPSPIPSTASAGTGHSQNGPGGSKGNPGAPKNPTTPQDPHNPH